MLKQLRLLLANVSAPITIELLDALRNAAYEVSVTAGTPLSLAPA
jgi:hypothetical protein